ncbi:hypothetical protein [Streptomyces sp. NPDC059759]|uniref:DUF7620 family protein n=1 Tax=Streptomyces sp. NPDC059759 TaxID=3346936 RepID=UPI003668678C
MLTWIQRMLRPHRDEEKGRPVTKGQEAANAALGRAEVDHALLKAQRTEVAAEADIWRERRRQNHFAELIRATVLGGEGR